MLAMNLKNRFRLVIFCMVALLVSIAVIEVIGIRYINMHIQQAIGMDDLVVNLYEMRILNHEYVATPSERVKQQWRTKYDQISSKLIKQPVIPDDVKDALNGLQQIFERLTSLPDAAPVMEASQKRLRNQAITTLNLESQGVIDWASDISRQTKDDIVPNLMLIGAVTLAVMLFMALAMITIMLITTRHILASVNCLKDGAEQIASGKLGFQVEQAGNDEIATLATAINQMSLDLMDSYRNLHEKTVQLEIEMAERQIIHEALEIKTVELEKEIEERRQAENALRESEEIFRRFMEYSPIYIFFKDDNMRALRLSKNYETMLGKPLVELLGKNMDDLFPSDLAKSMVADDMRIMNEGKAITVEEGLNGRFYSTIKFPIVIEGKPRYLAGYTIDITERKQAEMRLINTLDSLRNAVGATIQVMVSAVEARDPYTSGHQIRTADLARSIAMEMGLSQEKIEGIRMAGSIHDIGKLSIPAEILSKPTKLSDIEFSLIKEHARKGFEMLKDVESPWPLAEIVHQHHERMDGSGYPKNLKGEEICIEARILAVSDVVESMASHRPYRAGLGIDLALAEIEKHKGIYYDDAVADACLRLFREKSYTLEGT